ncbi:TetR/AcrR family transcriptional regulator [Kutzneria sp. CA-103260]|uniref:TetR/AcrR family transcriptional regulator n=1 Tax=Kutzneria sp. CA-103260 TaxID=2802641 RepID=UPI001BADE253|nr:TetR/AcrR family transcriptional regulator [Kutzneria sp. CA-103260]QUQ65790.1 TetR family transcriptional regulator [Kutzneria sp. CA-103260]
MSRWEPNARTRLERASLELFVERGYDNTTVAEIAERAGLTKRTFFRHFADKREVLFGGQEILSRLFTEAIAGAPASATPLETIAAALAAVAPIFNLDRFELVLRRQEVIAAHTDLQERELLKAATLTAVMAEGFRARGLADLAAGVAAELGQLAFRTAFFRWVASGGREFVHIAKEVVADLQTAAELVTTGQ